MKSYSELEVYQNAHQLATHIHDLTGFYDDDDEESETLVNEVRAVSRNVVRRISDAWTHRMFMANIEIHLNKAINEVEHTISLLKQCVEKGIIEPTRFDKKVKDYLTIKHELHDVMEKGEF